MKKLLFLVLLITSVSYGQGLMPTKLKITNNAISTTAPFVAVQETDGFINKINKSDLIEVIEYASAVNLPVTGVAGKIYVTLDNNRLYRWTGTIYQDLGYVDISGKVDKVTGKSLISDAEITRLSTVTNFDNSANTTALSNKVDKVTGKSLISDTEITRLATLANYTHPTNHPPSIITQDGSNRFVTDAEKSTWNAKQNALGYTAENLVLKNTPNGYAGLGADGKLISSQLPSITISDTFIAASQAAMLAVTAETGDVVVRTDLNKSFILKGANPAILSDWQELLTPTSAVTTVFGRNGAVTAQTGDYNADQITETATRKFQTANQNTFNDATSSIQTQINTKQATITAGTTAQYYRGDKTMQTLNSTAVGLANVNNTTDLLKPISTATQTALNGKENSFTKNTAFNKNFGTASGTVVEGGTLGTNAYSSTAYLPLINAYVGLSEIRAYSNYSGQSPGFELVNTIGETTVAFNGNLGRANFSGTIEASPATLDTQLATLGQVKGITDFKVDKVTGKSLISDSEITRLATVTNQDISGKENAFSKNTAFNKNFGSTAGTVAEGNDSRLNNGQTAFGWGNHAGLYSTITGSNINQASFRTALGLGTNAYNSTAYLPLINAYVGLSEIRAYSNYSGQSPGFELVNTIGETTVAFNGNLGRANFSGTIEASPATLDTQLATLGQVKGITDFKVDKVTGKSLISDSEITRLATVTNQDISGKYDKTGGTISGNVNVTGTVTASGGFFNSDLRLKNIFKRDGDVAYYTWKDGRDNKQHIGYVAQEVQENHPSQVQADDKGILSVNYVEILVEKIRVLEKRIEQLEKSK